MSQSARQKNQHIQVFVRARPLSAAERGRGSAKVLDTSDTTLTVRERPHDKFTKAFSFDRVFGPASKQVDVYRVVVMPLLEQVLLGYNCTVFAYGQTGTGKTYTMEGERSDEELPWDQDPGVGIIPRTLSHLFDDLRIQGVEFTVRVSFLELYNEELIDLLGPETDTTRLRLYEDANKKGSCIIQGLEEVTVHNKNDVYEILRLGSQKRQTAATLMNAHSSRSHTVFSVTVHIKENTMDGEELLKIGKLNLVDLAGSENIGRSGAVERRAREAGNINQSLLTLGRVITSLVERAPHVPYRESKLTRLLQDSLGGRTKTSIIAAVSPASCNLEETLSTLEYAQRAKSIQNRPEINQKLSKKTLMKEYTEEIERLRRDLLATREQTGVYLAPDNYASMCGRLEQQEQEIVEKVNHIRAMQEEMEKKEAVFGELRSALEQKTAALADTEERLGESRCRLQRTSEALQRTEAARDEQSHLVARRADTERRLTDQANQLLSTVETAAADLRGVHASLDRKRAVELRNETATQEFGAHHQADMVRLADALAVAFGEQRAFLARMDASLGAATEKRREEAAALTALVAGLAGAQRERLAGLEAAADDAAEAGRAWTAGQLEAAAARRREQGESQAELQRRLADGVGGVLARLAELDAAAERRQAELRQWLAAHADRLRRALTELAELTEARRGAAQREADERVAALEAENARLQKRQAHLGELIGTLQASLAAGTAAAASLAAAAAEDGAASREVLDAAQARQERDARAAAAHHTETTRRLGETQQHLADDTSQLERMCEEGAAEAARQAAEARAELERARADWEPRLAGLAAGWEEHLRVQETELRARAEADAAALEETRAHAKSMAAALQEGGDATEQTIQRQGDEFAGEIGDRRGELAKQSDETETAAAAAVETVRQRAEEVEVFVRETLQRDAPSGATPQRRQMTYPRYLAATSPHERILQRYRRARAAQAGPPLPEMSGSFSEAESDAGSEPAARPSALALTPAADPAEEPKTPDSDTATPNSGTPAPNSGTPAPGSDAPTPAGESRMPPPAAPLSRASSVSDMSDAGSDAENRGPERQDGFVVPPARRHQKRTLRAPKVRVTRQTAQSPRKGVLTNKNE